MSNIVQFPEQAYIVITEGTNSATGEQLFLLEYVEAGGRTIVGEYSTLREVAEASLEWERDGLRTSFERGGAA